jgi:hypothetical protein
VLEVLLLLPGIRVHLAMQLFRVGSGEAWVEREVGQMVVGANVGLGLLVGDGHTSRQ